MTSASENGLDAIRNTVRELASSDRRRHAIPESNIRAVSIFLDSLGAASARFACVRYENGDDIVTNGLICDQEPLGEGEYSYSFVPLGFIVSGNITVIKDGKGMKNLGEGDFLGLFETSDWIQTGQKRQIGDWSLVASGEAMVFYFGPSLLTDESEAASEFRTHLVSLAREDHVPQPITTLPLLDWVASHTMKVRPRDCAIIAHTHLLPNNLPLFRHLSSLVDFGRIYVMDKPYSTVRSALNDLVLAGFEVIPVRMEADLPYEFAVSKSLDVLWNKVIDDQKRRQYRKILIIDDGGDVWQSVPWDDLSGVSIAAVEQTQRGIARAERTGKRFPPIVSVASSGIKKNVESEFIGVSVVKKLDDLGILTSSGRVGIIGMGSIGSAVEKSLLERGIDPLFYDPVYHVMPVDSPRRRDSLDVLLEECDLIVGTTGTDALKGLPFERVTTGKKTLASASSADLEFSSLLKLAPHRSEPFETVSIPVHERLTIDILNGGYPINFDRQKDATPDDDIVLTRCLMYVGAMQALELIGGDAPDRAVFNLDPVSQKYLLSRWIDEKNTSGRTPRFSRADVDEIVNASSFVGGKEMKTIWMDQLNG